MCRLFYLIASLLYHYFTVVLLNHCLYLLVHVFCREAQLFVQHFVRSGETDDSNPQTLPWAPTKPSSVTGRPAVRPNTFAFAGITLS